MGEFKGTKGEWTICDNWSYDVDCEGWTIVQSIAHNNKPNATKEEAKANAQLIAAAPDLLEALIEAKHSIEGIWMSKNQQQELLDKIASVAESLISTAQADANAAQSDADDAQTDATAVFGYGM